MILLLPIGVKADDLFSKFSSIEGNTIKAFSDLTESQEVTWTVSGVEGYTNYSGISFSMNYGSVLSLETDFKIEGTITNITINGGCDSFGIDPASGQPIGGYCTAWMKGWDNDPTDIYGYGDFTITPGRGEVDVKLDNEPLTICLTGEGYLNINSVTISYIPKPDLDPHLTFSPDPMGLYDDAVSVTITTERKDEIIMYSLDGGDGMQYTEPFTLRKGTDVSAWTMSVTGASTDTVSVHYYVRVDPNIAFEPNELIVYKDTKILPVEFKNPNNVYVEFEIEDPTIVKMTATGNFELTGKVGETRIIATVQGDALYEYKAVGVVLYLTVLDNVITIPQEVEGNDYPPITADSGPVPVSITYMITDADKGEVSFGNGTDPAIVIPEEYTNVTVEIPKAVAVDDQVYEVTGIASNAFKNQRSVKKIIIPDSETPMNIGEHALDIAEEIDAPVVSVPIYAGELYKSLPEFESIYYHNKMEIRKKTDDETPDENAKAGISWQVNTNTVDFDFKAETEGAFENHSFTGKADNDRIVTATENGLDGVEMYCVRRKANISTFVWKANLAEGATFTPTEVNMRICRFDRQVPCYVQFKVDNKQIFRQNVTVPHGSNKKDKSYTTDLDFFKDGVFIKAIKGVIAEKSVEIKIKCSGISFSMGFADINIKGEAAIADKPIQPPHRFTATAVPFTVSVPSSFPVYGVKLIGHQLAKVQIGSSSTARYRASGESDPAGDNIILLKNTPVLIDADDDYISLGVRATDEGALTANEDNLLVAVTEDTTFSDFENLYILGNHDTFVKMTEENNHVKAGTAILKLPADTHLTSLELLSEEEAQYILGVEQIKTANERDDNWYNIGGLRVDKPLHKGIYIQKGKKLLVK